MKALKVILIVLGVFFAFPTIGNIVNGHFWTLGFVLTLAFLIGGFNINTKKPN